MIKAILKEFHEYRMKIYNFFRYRADSTFDLIDANAGQTQKESVVKLSLSPLFRREYSSITASITNLFRRDPDSLLETSEIEEDQEKLTQIIMEQCSKPIHKNFELFAVDCSPNPRIFANKLSDRGFIHSPVKVPGQKPVTIGHQYSTVVYLPEKTNHSEAPWVIPLSAKRVKTEESGTCIGIEQIVSIVSSERFQNRLCVCVSDSAYSNSKCLSLALNQMNLVNIARIRSNRKFYLPVSPNENESKKVGRPKIYGERWAPSNPGESDEQLTIQRFSAKGKCFYIKIERWNDRFEKGTTSSVCKNETGLQKSSAFLFDAVKVTVSDEYGKPKYKKPLWLMVEGNRRREIALEDIADSYFRRFDIEHFFRFAKQKLLLVDFQTPDVRHEENWWWLCLVSYTMLYGARRLANQVKNKWEKKSTDDGKIPKLLSPTEVQRDYERIILEIGTPACVPKPRGKSFGRVVGTKVGNRKDHKIVKKLQAKSPDAIKKAA